MSGIAAIIHFDGRPVERSQIEAMTTRMAFRGPDGISHWVDGSVALGQCMLHTTSESMAATLPLEDEDHRIVLIMDGRIDNFDELRARLIERGAQLRSRADAELVLQAYLMFGPDCTEHLEGDFATVIWDRQKRRVFCLRDIMGHKPFHYAWNGTTLSIASDVAALLALPWVGETENLATIAEFAEARWYSKVGTFWSDISRLPPASSLTATAQGITTRTYWEPDPEAPLPVRSEEDLAEYYLDLLTNTVKTHSRSHLPVACEASGGLDSSAIFALALNLQRNGTLPAPGLNGYTLKFEDDEEANDLEYARALSRHLNEPIAEFLPTVMPVDWYLEHAQNMRDFPGYPNGIMHFGIYEAAKDKGAVALLDGGGGDEWLAGNQHLDYVEGCARRDFKGLHRTVRADAHDFGIVRALGRLARYGVGFSLPEGLRRFLGNNPDDFDGQASGWLNPVLAHELSILEETDTHWRSKNRKRRKPLQDLMLSDAYRVRAFEIEERSSALHGLERRSPLDSVDIVNLSYAAPFWMKRRGQRNKIYHRRAFESLLPLSVVDRTDKAKFSSILHQQIGEVCDHLQTKTSRDVRRLLNNDRLKDFCGSSLGHQPARSPEASSDWKIWGVWGLCGALQK